MKPGDLVRCRIWGKTGLILVAPKSHGYDNRPGKLLKVLWSDGTQAMEHINNVEVISEAG